MNPVGGPNPILVRYFAGQESLEAAATEYVRICREWLEGSDTERRQRVTNLQRQQPLSGVPPIRELTDADLPKVRALMERVEAKLDLINTQAREYLSSAGNSAFDKTVRLLADDVRATLGERYVAVVWSFAAQVRKFFGGEDPSSKCVDDVQQYFQDTFVDTSWPACPRHPNHPLDFEDGSWRCPRDRSIVARLGELSGSRQRPA
jgi:hypothetical protein